MVDAASGLIMVWSRWVTFIVAAVAIGGGVATGREAICRRLSPYPTPITNNAVASVCGRDRCVLYSYMGMTRPADPSSITAASYKLDSAGKSGWVRIADAPMLNGKAKIAASAVSCAGNVYLIGGYSIEAKKEITEKRFYRYDPFKNDYVRLADVPIEVDDTVVGVVGDRYLYLISGWHGPTTKNTSAVQVYDTAANKWQQATSIPVAGRFGHSGGAVGNQLVFIDGCADTRGYPIVHDTWMGTIDTKDPAKIAWHKVETNPYSQTYRSAATSGAAGQARLLVLGGTDNAYNYNGNGYNDKASKPLRLLMEFTPATQSWRRLELPNNAYVPTMDHRGLVFFDGAWVTVGGMTTAGKATNLVQALSIDRP